MSTTALRMSVFSAIDGALRDDREEKVLCCRILMRLLVADGTLDPRERTLLEATMERHGLDGEHRARIWAELDPSAELATAARAEPLDTLLDRLPATALAELEQYLEWGAWADGQVVPAEQAILETVRARLGRAR
ncbi:MAG: TerB family tellurite resistance protein [Deltaproteobacteria bacterium]|nr:TerB family tellurite resistance protein [Nannocystaceae bacterium]